MCDNGGVKVMERQRAIDTLETQLGDVRARMAAYLQELGVEFVTVNGALVGLVALHPAQVRRLEQDEIAHVHRMQTA